jgi:hypothetical protein
VRSVCNYIKANYTLNYNKSLFADRLPPSFKNKDVMPIFNKRDVTPR